MKIERTKNAKRNIWVGLLKKAVVLLLQFLVRTAFIHNLGAEYLGLNSLFTSILMVLNVTELGFGSAIVFSMYEPIAKENKEELCALLNHYRKVYLVIGTVILIAGLTLMPFLPKLIKNSCPQELNIYVLYLMYLLNTVLSYFMFAYKKSILEAFQRNDYILFNEMLTVGLTNVVQLLLLLFWKSIYVYYVYTGTMLLFTFINNILNVYVANKYFPEYICKGRISAEAKGKIGKQVTGLMINRVCQVTRNSMDSIFVTAFLGLTMTTVFDNYFYIISALDGIMIIITSAMQAGIGNSIVAESLEKNYEDFKKINFIYMWLSGWITITLMCLYQNFMYLWVGETLMLSNWGAFLFSGYFFALRIGDIRATYASAAGLWWENRKWALLELIINVILNYILVQVWGLYGIVIATIIPLIFVNYVVGAKILYKCYFKEESLWLYYKDTLIYLAATVIAGLPTWLLCQSFQKYDFLGLFLRGIICCVIPNVLFAVCYFRTKKFKSTLKWLLAR